VPRVTLVAGGFGVDRGIGFATIVDAGAGGPLEIDILKAGAAGFVGATTFRRGFDGLVRNLSVFLKWSIP